MERLKLAFCVHNHQPVGNFDWVFAEGVQKCYLPFLELMAQHPSIRFSLHISGPLIEWMDEGAPRYHELVRAMVASGQVEMVGGGYYEPILPIWPKEQAVAQVKLMRHELKIRYGADARGMWLAERVWDPSLPQLLEEAKADYTILDVSHFRYAGITEPHLTGYFLTERAGCRLSVFPISKRLRYLIPFKEPEETIKFLKSVAEKQPGAIITYADDGEKFGIWPGTFDWVYTRKWLPRFLEALESERDWLEVIPLREALREPPRGRIYLPNASYEEMMEWALPADTILQYQDAMSKIERQGLKDECKPFVRGGFWDNFLVKYPESNLMHKCVLSAAAVVEKRLGTPNDVENLAEPWRNIFRAQCNCGYWHGLFGGVYLNYLRHAIWRNLIKAEAAVTEENSSKTRVVSSDIDIDGRDEIIVSDGVSKWGFTKAGAACFLVESFPAAYAFHNTMGLRPEAYHFLKQKPGGVTDDAETAGPSSIHDISGSIGEKPVYDRTPRFSFIDHFFPSDTVLNNFSNSTWVEMGDFWPQNWASESKTENNAAVIKFRRDGNVSGIPVTGVKEYRFNARTGKVEALIRFEPKQPWPAGRYGIAFNFTLLAPDAPDRYYLFDNIRPADSRMASVGAVKQVRLFSASDDYERVALAWEIYPPADVWRAPVMTLSRSEGGFEKTYQGSWALIHVPLPTKMEPLELRITWKIILKGE